VKPEKEQECAVQRKAGNKNTEASTDEESLRTRTGLCPVPKRYLFLAAGIVWLAAGINVLRMGLFVPEPVWHSPQILVAAVVFICFAIMFVSIVRKNVARIKNYKEDRIGIFRCFNVNGYVIMALMISLGFFLRYAQIWPMIWIQTFYTGLGAALIVAGFLFLTYTIKVR
jgi:TRAP-type C4-dicarboxylate transport system permease small subunit